MSPADIDAARSSAANLERAHPDVAALIRAMADELERVLPVYNAAVARHKAYFGASSIRAPKCKATMDLNNATARARGQMVRN